jgi:hypothetical protein
LSMKCLKVRQSKETQIELLTKYNLKKKWKNYLWYY